MNWSLVRHQRAGLTYQFVTGCKAAAHLNDELQGRIHPGWGVHRIMEVVLTQRNPHCNFPPLTTLELHKLCVIIPVVSPLMILQKRPHKMIKSKEIIVPEASLWFPPHLYVQATTHCKGFAPDSKQDSSYKVVPVFLSRGISSFIVSISELE